MENKVVIGGVVLAAGRSVRMGQPKLLLPWGDRPILAAVLDQMAESSFDFVAVVTGGYAQAISNIAHAYHLETIHNPHYEDGELLSSVQVAINALAGRCHALLIQLADMPLISSAILERLLAHHRQHRPAITAPVYLGQRGNPLIWSADLFPDLLALPPQSAPRTLFARHLAQTEFVTVESSTIFIDIDTPERYEQWRPRERPTNN